MNPAFNASMLRQYSVVFSQQARLLVEKLADQADSGRQFDLWPYMANANVDIITGKGRLIAGQAEPSRASRLDSVSRCWPCRQIFRVDSDAKFVDTAYNDSQNRAAGSE